MGSEILEKLTSIAETLPRVSDLKLQISPKFIKLHVTAVSAACKGILNSRNWPMPLTSFRVGRIVPEGYHSYGRFVIDTSLNRQDDILALLSEADMRRIGVELGVISRLYYPMPTNMHSRERLLRLE